MKKRLRAPVTNTRGASLSVVVLAALVACQTERDPAKAMGHLERGIELFNSEQYQAAIGEFQASVRLNPAAPVYCLLGLSRQQSAGTPVKPIAGGALGYALLGMGDFDKAIALDVNCACAYYHKGVTHLAAGQRDNAIDAFSKGITAAETSLLVRPVFNQIREALIDGKDNLWESVPDSTKHAIDRVLERMKLADTELASALKKGDLDLIRKALDLGADTNLRMGNQAASEWALSNGRPDIAELLAMVARDRVKKMWSGA